MAHLLLYCVSAAVGAVIGNWWAGKTIQRMRRKYGDLYWEIPWWRYTGIY